MSNSSLLIKDYSKPTCVVRPLFLRCADRSASNGIQEQKPVGKDLSGH